MFESFYGLTANPFRLSADERFRYAHKTYAKAWSYLKYALEQGEGFVLITGRPGTGKTTLIRDMLSELDSSTLLAVNLVTNQLQGEELLRMVALAFGFEAQDFNKATLLTRIGDYASELHAGGRRVIILVDEAQNLTENGLEELRLLSNLQIGNKPLFQIFLIGQEELRGLIYGRGLKIVQQRILAACRVEPMDARQVEGYIEHRLGIVGWNDDPRFEEGIFPLIQKLTRGVPREINNVMGRLLLYGALEEKHLLTVDDLRIVAQELKRESRTDFDIEETWSSYEEELLETGGEEPPAKQPDLEAQPPESPGVPATEIEETSEPRASEADSEGEPTAQAFRERQAILHEELFGDDEDVTSDMAGFEGLADQGSDLELPSILIDEEVEARQHSHLLTDVGDLLDEGVTARRLRQRWRWLFYPIALLILTLSLLMPGPEELWLIWRDTLRHFWGKPAVVEQPTNPSPEPQAPQQDMEIQPILREQPASDGIFDEVEERGQRPQTGQPSPLQPADSTSLQREQPLPPKLEQPPQSQPEQADGDSGAKADREMAAAVAPDRSYLVAIDRESGVPHLMSLDVLASILEFAQNNPRALIVVTGFTQGEAAPLEQMREALQLAESLAGYFVKHGISPRQISIEGGVTEDATDSGKSASGETLEEGYARVRVRLIILRNGGGTEVSAS